MTNSVAIITDRILDRASIYHAHAKTISTRGGVIMRGYLVLNSLLWTCAVTGYRDLALVNRGFGRLDLSRGS